MDERLGYQEENEYARLEDDPFQVSIFYAWFKILLINNILFFLLTMFLLYYFQ